MLDMAVNIAASTDGPKPFPGLDMFNCMRLFQQSYRDLSGDPSLLPHEKMLELVTINAAKVVGLDRMVGSLEAGKRADIITVNLLNPKLMPNFNTIHSLVMSGTASDVDNVMVDGEFLVRNGAVLKANEKEILVSAQKEVEQTVERAKLSGFAYLSDAYWGQARKPPHKELFDLEWQRQDGGHY
jgi:cytosine/adenosine deaminase-related metal-dependent hydrolase